MATQLVPRPHLIIFDCDGVLVDSEPLAAEALQRALAAEGLFMSRAGMDAAFTGRRMSDILVCIEGRLGRSLPSDFESRLQAETYAKFREALKAFPGIPETLEILHSSGIRTCVASSGSHEKLAISLGVTGLAKLFAGRIFSGTEVERGKPAPDLFLHAAARMETPPEHCLVVEDSETGLMAAKAAGMKALGFHNRAHSPSIGRHADLPRVVGLEG